MSKRIVILGGGESGVGAALLGKKEGYEVFLSDAGFLKEYYRNELKNAGIDFEEGTNDVKKILVVDEVMKSGIIPEKNEMEKKIRRKGIAVIGEIEVAYRFKS